MGRTIDASIQYDLHVSHSDSEHAHACNGQHIINYCITKDTGSSWVMTFFTSLHSCLISGVQISIPLFLRVML